MRVTYLFNAPDMNKFLLTALVILVVILLDFYVYQLLRTAFRSGSLFWQRAIKIGYWSVSMFIILLFASFMFFREPAGGFVNAQTRNLIATFFFGVMITKVILLLFVLTDDAVRLGQWLFDFFRPASLPETASQNKGIPRSEFLAKTGVIVATAPTLALGYGIISGAHDYQIRRRQVRLPNLPKSFHGLKIAQLSDIHSGSFFNKTAVKAGVEMLLAEKPDVVFFTGDLVNNFAEEVCEYVPIFEKVKAPLGVYSVLGNHDYADYVYWSNSEDKMQNLHDLIEAHRLMGWKLLNDTHTYLKQGSDQIAIIGVQNWGAKGHFPKYGNLQKAVSGIKDASVKLLLSHDPSHWDAQIRPQFPDIDITFSGHTHGMQFGVEIGNFHWSPVQYMYPQWADLYQINNQYLYVNRGFGFIGFPGRIGILPEITIIELVS